MTYTLTSGAHVIRDADGACIPADPANADRAAYDVWVAGGGVPTPAPAAAPAPLPALTPRQLRLWLLSRGITGAMVAAAIAALPESQREAAEIEWEYSTGYLRTHPLMDQLGAAFSLTPEAIDAAWPDAAAL